MKIKFLRPILVIITALNISGCTQTVETKKVADLSDLAHIHSVATDGTNVYVASHHGLYLLKDGSWKLQGEDFDIMGLSFDSGKFYASGHPGPTQNLPNPVGVLTSDNLGETWNPLSLTGEVDFHLLEVVGENFIGAAASHGAVIRSSDGGENWSQISIPQFTDMTLNPINPNQLIIAGDDGLSLSEDFGESFSAVPNTENFKKVDWHSDYILAATENELFRSTATSPSFERLNQKFIEISDIQAQGDLVIVMDSEGIYLSKDLGNTFSLVATL